MEGRRCVSRLKSGKHAGEQCPHPATRGDRCGVHSPKEGKKKQQQRGLGSWLVRVMMGCPPREDDDDNTEVTATANDNNVPAPALVPPRQCIEAAQARAPQRARTGCSSARFVGTMPVDNTIYVCNVEGSSEDKGSWKPFCSRYLAVVGEEYPKVCRVKDCQRKVTATGHMYWRDCKGTPNGGWRYNYLAGICSHHNSSIYNNKYVPLKKGHVVIIEENPVVQQQNLKKGRKKK